MRKRNKLSIQTIVCLALLGTMAYAAETPQTTKKTDNHTITQITQFVDQLTPQEKNALINHLTTQQENQRTTIDPAYEQQRMRERGIEAGADWRKSKERGHDPEEATRDIKSELVNIKLLIPHLATYYRQGVDEGTRPLKFPWQ